MVIPLFNKANHILDTLKSVYEQSYPAHEVIIIDDGSTDGGAELVAQKGFAGLRLIKQENQGVSAARNHGIDVATHDYIAFLDADDLWQPFFLDEMVKLIRRFPHTGFYASCYQCIDNNGDYIDPKIIKGDLNPNGVLMNNYFEIASRGDLPFMISSTVIHKGLVKKIGGFPVGEKIGEDQDFFARVALQGTIAYSPNIHLFYHREAENKATLNNIPSEECPFSQRLHKLTQSQKLSEEECDSINRYSAAHLCHLARLNIQAGKYPAAKRLLSDSRCRLKPKHWLGLWSIATLKQTLHSASNMFKGEQANKFRY